MDQILVGAVSLAYPIIVTMVFVFFNKKKLTNKKKFIIYSIIFGYIILVLPVVFENSLFALFYFLAYYLSSSLFSLVAFIVVTGPQIVLCAYLLKKYSEVK